MKTLREKYKEKFNEWATASTSHAIPNIFRSENIFVKIMWSIILLASFSYCTVTIVKSIIDYTKYETTVSIKKIQELPQVFPAVTVCNINPYDDEYASDYLSIAANSEKNPSCFHYLNQSVICQTTNMTSSTYCQTIEANLTAECRKESDFTISHVLLTMANFVKADLLDIKNIGYDIAKGMDICSFNNKDCNAEDFKVKTTWINRYGFCYTFNSGENNTELLKTSDKGRYSGLKIELAAQRPYESTYFKASIGIYLSIHNQSDSPFEIFLNGVFLPPGNKIYVGIDREFNYKQPYPYSDCIDELKSDNQYAQRLFSFFEYLNISYYNQDICFNLCYQDKLIDRCRCSNLRLPTIRGTWYCATENEIICMNEFNSEYFEADTDKYCHNACPQRCTTIKYLSKIDYSSYPTTSRLSYLKNNVYTYIANFSEMEKFGKESLSLIEINYENKYYTAITENPTYTPESMLGNIGGQLGLFIGISLLSVIELLELAIDLLYLWFHHKNTITNAERNSEQ